MHCLLEIIWMKLSTIFTPVNTFRNNPGVATSCHFTQLRSSWAEVLTSCWEEKWWRLQFCSVLKMRVIHVCQVLALIWWKLVCLHFGGEQYSCCWILSGVGSQWSCHYSRQLWAQWHLRNATLQERTDLTFWEECAFFSLFTSVQTC